MKNIVLFAFSLLISTLFSQKQYQFPEPFNQRYNFRPDLAEKRFTVDQNPDGNISAVEKYVVTNFYGEQYKFDNNSIYLDWEVEKYLRKIVDSILPEGKNKKNIDIYLGREWGINAYISRFGNIFLNIGMISEMKNEADLAHLIAHLYGHYIYKHAILEKKILKHEEGNYSDLDQFMELEDKFELANRKFEIQADSVANCFLNQKKITSVPMTCLKYLSLSEKILQNSVAFQNMLNTASKEKNNGKKPDSLIYKESATPLNARNYFIDSIFFFRLKKIATEERKKISFEKGQFDLAINFAFIDYLYEPKNNRNLYYIIEGIRRTIYSNPELAKKGFLAEDIADKDIYSYNKSILHKPEYCFPSYEQYNLMKSHPFFTDKIKPFNTYEEAFFYFTDQAIKNGLHEANFSKALYYFSLNNQDSSKKYCTKYQEKNGLYSDLAADILEKGKPLVSNGKTFILYNNIKNFTGDDVNYYLTIKRKKYNDDIKKELARDSSKVELLILNELLGNMPFELNKAQKLIYNIDGLYRKEDIEVCQKSKLSSKFSNDNRTISNKFKKNLIIYAPELYNWFKEKNCNKLLYVDVVYDYDEYFKEDEVENGYTLSYLDINQDRPYFKTSKRTTIKRKESEMEIRKSITAFLYE